MWICPKCQEEVEDGFEKCWNCGTSKEGVEDPTFQKEASSAGSWQPIASGLVWIFRCLAIVFTILGIYETVSIDPWAVNSRAGKLLTTLAQVCMMLAMSEVLRLLLRIEQNTRSKNQSGTL